MEQAKKAFKTIVMMSSKIIERGDNDSFRKYESQRLLQIILLAEKYLDACKKISSEQQIAIYFAVLWHDMRALKERFCTVRSYFPLSSFLFPPNYSYFHLPHNSELSISRSNNQKEDMLIDAAKEESKKRNCFLTSILEDNQAERMEEGSAGQQMAHCHSAKRHMLCPLI